MKFGDAMSTNPWIPVVGVAKTARLTFPIEAELEPEPAVFVSMPVGSSYSSSIVIRPTAVSIGTALAVQRVLKDELPPKTYVWTNRWLENYDEMLSARAFTLRRSSSDSARHRSALAAAGLFSVLSYSVGPAHALKFAVRVALGADRRDVMRLVMRDGVVMELGGTAIGAIFGMWAGFLLNSFLWGVYPLDVEALVLAEAILFACDDGELLGSRASSDTCGSTRDFEGDIGGVAMAEFRSGVAHEVARSLRRHVAPRVRCAARRASSRSRRFHSARRSDSRRRCSR